MELVWSGMLQANKRRVLSEKNSLCIGGLQVFKFTPREFYNENIILSRNSLNREEDRKSD